MLMLLAVPAGSTAADYIIGEGDTLAISVWGVDRLNFSVKVRPDGMITVPGLGEVSASGLMPKELQAGLTEKLKSLVKNPIVTVTVAEITNSKVYIFGSGVKPGVFELNRKSTLLQLLCTLPDLKLADLNKAYLVRKGDKIKLGFYRLFVDGEMSEDIPLESNDAIFIPLLQDRVVYVLGEVTTPKAIEYREGMTIMEAILESGGFSKFASLNDISIVRKNEGKETTITVKAKKLLKDGDLSQNMKLKVGDYVIVSESYF
jgi:polysaccharide export outer membrane protein